jgi:hypothetical protein
LLYLFLADRTTIFLKEQKHFDPWVFGIVNFVFLAVGLATTRDSGKDQGFLGRDMTDEWKGWMQSAVFAVQLFWLTFSCHPHIPYLRWIEGLGYLQPHPSLGRFLSLHDGVWPLLLLYVLATVESHSADYKKREFGFQRIAMVMVRLNLLSIALPYTMHTNYVFYYFAPLVSWW